MDTTPHMEVRSSRFRTGVDVIVKQETDVGNKQVVAWYPSSFKNDVGQGKPETTGQLLCAFRSILFSVQYKLIPWQDLVRRLLAPLASLPSPIDPLSSTDALLARISDALFRVSPDSFSFLGNEPKNTHSSKCPLDPTAPDAIRIACASNIDKRLALLKGDDDVCETPEIRLESDLNGGPDSTSSPSSTATTFASRRQRCPTTLLPSKAYNAPPAHRAHLSALLRLLYIHSSLNPAVQSPHVPWLLVPLYSALVGETDEDAAAHAEADTFWVFEALVGEIAEMEEEDGGKVWRQKLSERVKWADRELAASLVRVFHLCPVDSLSPTIDIFTTACDWA